MRWRRLHRGRRARAAARARASRYAAPEPPERVRSAAAVAAAAPPRPRATRSSPLLGEALLAAASHAARWRPSARPAEGAGAVAARARWRAAAALHAGGFAEEAVAAWRRSLGDRLASNFEPADRLAFALDLLRAGEPDRAAEILRSIWLAQPERPEAAAAEAPLGAGALPATAIPAFTGEERVARAFRLVALGRAGEAAHELKKAAVEPPRRPSRAPRARRRDRLSWRSGIQPTRGATDRAARRARGRRDQARRAA